MADKKVNIILELIDKASSGIEAVTSRIQSAIIGISKYVAAAAAAFGAYSLKTAGDFEQWSIAFETMLGSADKARAFMNQLVEFSQRTPFNTVEVVEYAKRLMAMGIATDQVIPSLESLGNIAAGVGREKLPQLVLAFGQVSAKGRLMGEELSQFTEAGVPLLGELAKGFGVSNEEMQKMISNGQVGFPAVEEALRRMTSGNGKFANLMEKQSKSFLGILSNVKDKFDMIANAAGQGILDVFKDDLSNFQAVLQKINLEDVRFKISTFLLSVETDFKVTGEILKSFLMAPFRFQTYATVITEFAAGLDNLWAAIKGGWSSLQAYRKKLNDQEIKDGTTLEQRIEKIKQEGNAEKKKLLDEHLARVKQSQKDEENAEKEKANKSKQSMKSVEMVATETEESRKKASKEAVDAILYNEKMLKEDKTQLGAEALKNALEYLEKELGSFIGTAEDKKKIELEIKKLKNDILEDSDKKTLASLETQLRSSQYTNTEKIKLLREFADNVATTEEEKTRARKKADEIEIEDANRKSQKLQNIGASFATDFNKGLSQMAEFAIFGEEGAAKKITNGLTSIFGNNNSDFANVLGGAAGAFLTPALAGFALQAVGALFGSGQKTVAQQAEESFRKMVSNVNVALDGIGKEKSTIEKQVDLLDQIKSVYGLNSDIPQQFLETLGLKGGTVNEGLKALYGRLGNVNNKDVIELKSQLDNAKKSLSEGEIAKNIYLKGAQETFDAQERDLANKYGSRDNFGYLSNIQSLKDQYARNIFDINNNFDPSLIAMRKLVDYLTEKLSATSEFSLQEAMDTIRLQSRIKDLTGSTDLQQFASGGVVRGSSYSGDRVLVRANSGEMILTPQDQSSLLQMIRGGNIGSGKSINVNVLLDGQVLGKAIIDLQNLRDAGLN